MREVRFDAELRAIEKERGETLSEWGHDYVWEIFRCGHPVRFVLDVARDPRMFDPEYWGQ